MRHYSLLQPLAHLRCPLLQSLNLDREIVFDSNSDSHINRRRKVDVQYELYSGGLSSEMISTVWRYVADPHVRVAQVVNKVLAGIVSVPKNRGHSRVRWLDFGGRYMYNRRVRSNGFGIEILPNAAVNAAVYETDRLGHFLGFLRGLPGRRSRCQHLAASDPQIDSSK
jgi:hypothetical protein